MDHIFPSSHPGGYLAGGTASLGSQVDGYGYVQRV